MIHLVVYHEQSHHHNYNYTKAFNFRFFDDFSRQLISKLFSETFLHLFSFTYLAPLHINVLLSYRCKCVLGRSFDDGNRAVDGDSRPQSRYAIIRRPNRKLHCLAKGRLKKTRESVDCM